MCWRGVRSGKAVVQARPAGVVGCGVQRAEVRLKKSLNNILERGPIYSQLRSLERKRLLGTTLGHHCTRI